MAPRTLLDLIRIGLDRNPAGPFVTVPGGPTFTYGDAWDGAGRLVAALRAADVRPGDRVVVQLDKSPSFLLLHLACVRAGAVFIPLNTAYTEVEVGHLVSDAEPALVVVDPRRSSLPVACRVLTLDGDGRGSLAALAGAGPRREDDHEAQPDDLAAIVYTSGTTGRPKGALLSHANLVANANALHAAWGFGPHDVLLHVLPLFHVHGLFVAVHCVLRNGTAMVLLPAFDVDAVLGALPQTTVMMGVPTHYTRLLADPRFDADACRSIRLFVSGSAPLLASTHKKLRLRTGHVVLERYGMSETLINTSNPLDGDRRPGTVGLPLPGVEVRIADPAGGPVAAGEVGGIEVRGPNVFAGYWRRPELSATEFTADGWFRTGDLGTFDADGYLTIVGRSKDLIITGGLNVYPSEVEAVLDSLPGVAESAVIGVPDDDFGERVVAVVVASIGEAVNDAEVREAARVRLAGFQVPKQVVVVTELPRNALGKVEKEVLRRNWAETISAGADAEPYAPASESEAGRTTVAGEGERR